MTALEAYARRAEEYTELLGSVEAMAPADVRRIETWARTACGPLLDLGCGPGHWTSHLGALGLDVEGWDPVAEFVRSARDRHPGTVFRRAALADLDGHPGAWGGILAWYSLIHLEPAEMPGALAALHRALRPGGTLLLGFFDLAGALRPRCRAGAALARRPDDRAPGGGRVRGRRRRDAHGPGRATPCRRARPLPSLG